MGIQLMCTCGEIIDSDKLIPEKVFAGNEIEPPEYIYRCPYCGQDEELMDEYYEESEEDE